MAYSFQSDVFPEASEPHCCKPVSHASAGAQSRGHLWQLWTVSINGASDSARLALSMAMSAHNQNKMFCHFSLCEDPCLHKWLCLFQTLPTNAASGTGQPKTGIDFDVFHLVVSFKETPSLQTTLKIRVVRRKSLSGKRTGKDPLL